MHAAVDDRRAATAAAWMPNCAGLPKSRPSATPFKRLLREHTGQQRTDRAADAMRRDDVERIVERRLGAG